MLDTLAEHYLHADADAEHRAGSGQPPVDDLVAANRADPGHAGRERAHPRDHEAVRAEGGIEVGGHLGVGAGPLQGPLGGADVARPVVQDRDPGPSAHRVSWGVVSWGVVSWGVRAVR